MLTFKEAQVLAYEKAQLCKQTSPAHCYWVGCAHAFGAAVKVGMTTHCVSDDFFELPPYIPADKLEAVK